MATFVVKGMRVRKASDSVRERDPERWGTVSGAFSTPDGKSLSIRRKDITFDMLRDPETVIDTANGILTVPDGQRGRRAQPGLSQDDINAELTALRKATK